MFERTRYSLDQIASKAERLLGLAHITINQNAIPNDAEKPFVTSGIRLDTPAMMTRGFDTEEARRVGNPIADVLNHPADEGRLAAVRNQVQVLTRRFPVYR